MSRRPAAFVDRDGTIVQEAHYLADPDHVIIVPGAAAALRALRDAGFVIVIVTNQSGIARGLITDEQFRAVQRRVHELLHAQHATIDAVFHCPHHPDFTGPCDCRKPALGMYRASEEQLNVDLTASIHIGDRVRDVLPALATGGRGYLVRTGYGDAEAEHAPAGITVLPDLQAVARHVTGKRQAAAAGDTAREGGEEA